MGTTFRNLLLAGVVGLGLTSACMAQDATAANNSSPLVIYHSVQGNNLILFLNTTPPVTSYALTGELSENQRSMHAWQQQTGPAYQFGNGQRIVVAPAR